MKVIYIIDTNHPNVANGSNVALLNILDEIKKYNVEPMVIAAHEGSLTEELKKRKISFKITHHQCHIYPRVKSIKNAIAFVPRLLQLLFRNYKAKLKLINIIEEFKPNIIHTNIGQLQLGYKVAKKLNIPHVWHIREYQDLALGMTPLPSKSVFINRLNSSINYSIAITKGIYNHYKMKNNASVIYDGVLKENKIQFKDRKDDYFLFLGRLNEQKGISELIDAFIDFSKFNDNFKLLIAGDGSENFINNLKNKVIQSDLSKRIHFLGYRNDISELLSNATALVVPSKNEGFGFITVEAMFNGCLVVGNNSGGTKEIIEPENLGLLYIGHTDLVLKLKEIVTLGIDYYNETIKKAQINASRLYSQEQNAIQIINLYKEILIKNKK